MAKDSPQEFFSSCSLMLVFTTIGRSYSLSPPADFRLVLTGLNHNYTIRLSLYVFLSWTSNLAQKDFLFPALLFLGAQVTILKGLHREKQALDPIWTQSLASTSSSSCLCLLHVRSIGLCHISNVRLFMIFCLLDHYLKQNVLKLFFPTWSWDCWKRIHLSYFWNKTNLSLSISFYSPIQS